MKYLIDSIMETRPKEGGDDSGKSREEIVAEKILKYQEQIIYDYPEYKVRKQINKLNGPKGLNQKGFEVPLNTFLMQEIERM